MSQSANSRLQNFLMGSVISKLTKEISKVNPKYFIFRETKIRHTVVMY